MSKKQTEKSPPKKKHNPNVILKYSGMGIQMLVMLGLAVFLGQKLDAHFAFDKAYMTALCVIIAFPITLYWILKDLL